MRGIDVLTAAIGNTRRSKTRTTLTVVAIVIGAFTLTLTSGVGTGINAYIDRTVAAIGADDVMTITKSADGTEDDDAPRPYDPDAAAVGVDADVHVITPPDLDRIAAVEGVLSVAPTLSPRPDYISHEGSNPVQVAMERLLPGMRLDLAAGEQPIWEADDYQIALPVSYVASLGYPSDEAAIGTTITLGITAVDGTKSTFDATVVGVSEAVLTGGGSVSANDALTAAMYDAQTSGLSESARASYAEAVVRFDPAASGDEITALKDRLATAGYAASTVEDSIGAFRTVIDAIVLVLNGFAIIALLAAGFGIVNTLLMSVQERTREIGLMKAMGMPSGSVFGLFSTEAVYIGFLGSAIGAVLAILTGSYLSGILAGDLLADLPGLSIVAFEPVPVALIVVTVMGIAFLAGTIPALRAARQDPIDALRYE